MPNLSIPLGYRIEETDQKSIEIHVPNTKFWILGIQKPTKLWNAYLVDKQTTYKEILKKDVTTKSFTIFSNVILKSPFPYSGKRAENAQTIKRFIKNKTNKKHDRNKKQRRS